MSESDIGEHSRTLTALLDDLASSHREQEIIRTPTGSLLRLSSRSLGGADLVVKQAKAWTGTSAIGLYTTLRRCAAWSNGAGVPPFAPEAYWYGTQPPFVCMEWVEGRDLRDWMRSMMDLHGSRVVIESAIDVMDGVGELIARFHLATAGESSEVPVKDQSRVEGRLAPALTASLAGKRRWRSAGRVRSVEDLGPHNIVIADDDALRLIDLPPTSAMVPAEVDLAQAVQRVVGCVRRSVGRRYVPDVRWYRQAVDRSVAAYERERSEHSAGSDPDSGPDPVDRALIYASMTVTSILRAATAYRRLPKGRRRHGVVYELGCALSFVALCVGARMRCRG